MTGFDVRRSNLNLLPALEALLVEGSVSGAARRMHVSQSAMSHSLARLREAFGDPLLVSTGRRVVPTPLGARLAADLSRALDRLGEAVRPPAPFDPRTAKRVFRLATVDYFELTALPAILEHLSIHAPLVDLEIERVSPAQLPALVAGEIDLALVGESAGLLTAGLCRLPLHSEGFSVIARRDHPAIRRKLDLETYLSLGHVLVSVEGRRDGAVDRALAKLGRTRRVALRVPHFVSAPLAVVASDHVCTIADPIARRARELFGVRVFAPPLELPAVGIVALWSRRLDDDPASRWFRELFFGRSRAPRPGVRRS